MKTAAWILAAAVLVGAGAYAYLAARPTKAPDPDAEGPAVRIIKPARAPRLVLEAEEADAVEPPVRIVADVEGASHGRAAYLGPEKVNESATIRQYNKGYDGASHPGFARWSFVPETSGNYRIWVRVRWSDDCGDSLDVAVDGTYRGTVQGNADKENPRWDWRPLGSDRAPVTVHLEAGRAHTLTLANREDDLHFDQVLLIGESSELVPVGIQAGPEPPASAPAEGSR
jgi:hypothetical protein